MATAFRRFQIGKETTRGTGVAATIRIVNGVVTVGPDTEHYVPNEDRNSLAERAVATLVRFDSKWSWTGPWSYEQALFFFAMCLKGSVSPATPGGGTNSRTWTFLQSLTASNAQNAYTLEAGDDNQEVEAVYGMVRQIQLKFQPKGPCVGTVDMFARSLAKSTFTGSLAAVAQEPIITPKTKLYIDTTWAGLGGTIKSTLLREATVTIPGVRPYETADGELYFSTHTEPKRTIGLEMKVKMAAAAISEYDKHVVDPAPTMAFIRLKTTGSVIEAAITKHHILDMAIRYDEPVEMFDDDDGQTTATLKGHTYEDLTSGSDFSAEVQNAIASL